MSNYSGRKATKKWIESNLFQIHEYANGGPSSIYNDLLQSLNNVLKGKRNPFKIEEVTKFNDFVQIQYSKGIYSLASFKLFINKNERHIIK